MGLRTGAGIGRFLRDLGMTTPQIIGLMVFLVVGFIAVIVASERKKSRDLQKTAFRGLTFGNEVGVLHLVAQGASTPKGDGLLTALRGFSDAAEVYEYVYKKFDEAVFAKILIHPAGSDTPLEFVHDSGESDEQNLARLQAVASQR